VSQGDLACTTSKFFASLRMKQGKAANQNPGLERRRRFGVRRLDAVLRLRSSPAGTARFE